MIVDLTEFAEHVEIDITSLPVGTVTITVERQAADDVRPVRGARDRVVAGTGDLVRDWEVPLGVPVTYRIVAYSSSGGVLGTGFGEVELPAPAASTLWLSDPLEEGSARVVRALRGTDEERQWLTPVGSVVPFGRDLPSLQVGSRARVQEWPLSLLTETQQESDELREFLTTATFLLVRPPANIGLPPLLYGVPAAVRERPIHTSPGVSLWELPLTLSGGPLVHIVSWVWTYGDLEALGMVYGDLSAMFPTYRDLQRGPA